MISLPFLRQALLVLFCLAGFRGAAEAAHVSGNVFYRERMALPPGYVVKVDLLDVSRQDAPAETLGAVELTPSHQVPVPYELSFDEARIEPSHLYAVRAQIRVDGRIMFASTKITPVITRGVPRQADLWLQRVASPKAGAETFPAALVGEWVVEDIAGGGIIDNPRSTLRIDAGGHVSGLGGCNRFASSAKFSGEGLRIGPLATTMMACIPAIGDRERRYFAALADVRSARFDGPRLLLCSADGSPLVKLTRIRR